MSLNVCAEPFYVALKRYCIPIRITPVGSRHAVVVKYPPGVWSGHVTYFYLIDVFGTIENIWTPNWAAVIQTLEYFESELISWRTAVSSKSCHVRGYLDTKDYTKV